MDLLVSAVQVAVVVAEHITLVEVRTLLLLVVLVAF
jgi:hypothetical protein